jgi:uncharacterized protein YodC (DUF2158 family)
LTDFWPGISLIEARLTNGHLLQLHCSRIDSPDFTRLLAMPAFKSGDLVILKSGGPIMTIDTVNTDIFDDDKITGVLCVWFVGTKLERVRFDHGAIDPIDPQAVAPRRDVSEDISGDYKAVLDNMVGALNTATEEPAAARPAPRRRKPATRAANAEGAQRPSS